MSTRRKPAGWSAAWMEKMRDAFCSARANRREIRRQRQSLVAGCSMPADADQRVLERHPENGRNGVNPHLTAPTSNQVIVQKETAK